MPMLLKLVHKLQWQDIIQSLYPKPGLLRYPNQMKTQQRKQLQAKLYMKRWQTG